MTAEQTSPSAQDVLDGVAGIVPGSALDALRRERPQTRDNVQASYVALFEGDDATGVAPSERLAIASFLATLHGDVPAAAHYRGLLEARPDGAALADATRRLAALGATQGPYGAYPPGPLSVEDTQGPLFSVEDADRADLGERLAAAFEHAHLLVFHPRDAKASDLIALTDAGWSTSAVVTLSQIVAYLSFQIRAAHGLRVLAAAA